MKNKERLKLIEENSQNLSKSLDNLKEVLLELVKLFKNNEK